MNEMPPAGIKPEGVLMKTRLFSVIFIAVGSLLSCLFFSCVTAPKKVIELEHFGDLTLKYPIVLAHGFSAEDRKSAFSPWGRIPDTLREHGVKVYYGNTDAWGLIETNAGLLKETVDKVLKETGKEKVNIIAHSKGGLDARYMIWKYNYGDKVASLTTISTPHHGSVVADYMLYKRNLFTGTAVKLVSYMEQFYDDLYPDAYSAAFELTTEKLKDFNKNVTMDDKVFYQSVYSTMNKPSDDPYYSQSYKYMKKLEGPNDGLVSENSARWGNNIIKVDGGISHSQIVDDEENPYDMTILNIYLRIANDLRNRGL